MASRVNPKIQRMLQDRKLTRIKPDKRLILKEVIAATSDLQDAEDSLARGKFKWATVQAYYSMFHASRALLYTAGYREKSHRALLNALEEIYVKASKLSENILRKFQEGISLREEADYGLIFSESSTEQIIADAKEFLREIKEILGIK